MNVQGFCPNCGKLIEDKSLSYCIDCYKNERSDYDQVRDYIRNNPNSNAMDVAKGTGIDISTISKFIKEKTLLLRQ